MNHLRASLFLLVLVALAVSAAPAFAAAAPVANPAANLCPAPALSPATGTPAAPSLKIFPPPNYIHCDCKLCEEKPDVICQISPSGYSIVCSDWYQLNC